MKTFFMRGKNTENIVADAKKKLSVTQIVIVCRDNDRLKKDGDLTVNEIIITVGQKPVQVVANGGTTSQVFGIISKLYNADVDFSVLDVQKDYIKPLFILKAQDNRPYWHCPYCGTV